MQRKSLLSFSLILAILLSHSLVKASHINGGELNYTAVNGTIYRVVLKYYLDCVNGSTEPPNVALCLKNTCNPTNNYIASMTRVLPLSGNGRELQFLCTGITSCQGFSSSIYGLREWYYEAVVTLSGRCADWTFSVTIPPRSYSSNIVTNNNFYVEAKLNNLNFAQNNSTSFTNSPDAVSCTNNTSYTYNLGGLDADGDSLVYELIGARSNQNCDQPVPIAYTFGASSQMPFGFSNFTFNVNTGQVSVSNTRVGQYVVVIKCTEFRNGQFIGSIMRDMIFTSYNCNSLRPSLLLDTMSLQNAVYANKLITAYADSPFSFCFDGSIASSNGMLQFNSDADIATPGGFISATGLGSNQARGCFSWRAPYNDTGLKELRVMVKDTNCAANSVIYPKIINIQIRILPSQNASPSAIKNIKKYGFKVFPNPNNGIIEVEVESSSNLYLSTIEGKQIHQYFIKNKESIDLSNLANGMYLLKIVDAYSGELMLSEKLVLRK